MAISDRPAVDRGPDTPAILHVCPGFGVGGAETRTCRLINHFGRRFRHTILPLDGNTACAERLERSAAVVFAPPPPRIGNPVRRACAIAARLAAAKPDLLITYNWGSIEWAAVNRVCRAAPHVHVEDGFGADEVDRRKLRRSWFRRLALAGSRVVVPSRTLWTIARREWRIDEGRLILIANGIDLARYAPAAARAPGAGPVVFGTIAALRPEKNIGRLLRAFAALGPDPPVRLLIAGDGPERPALEAMARALGVDGRLAFAGFTAEPDRFLAGLDVFAITSDTEQLPTAVIEAMATGLPVAGVAVGDVPDMVAEGNRPLIVARDDEAGLAAAMRRLAGDPALRRRLGRDNRAAAEARFAESAMFAAHERLYARLARGDAAP